MSQPESDYEYDLTKLKWQRDYNYNNLGAYTTIGPSADKVRQLAKNFGENLEGLTFRVVIGEGLWDEIKPYAITPTQEQAERLKGSSTLRVMNALAAVSDKKTTPKNRSKDHVFFPISAEQACELAQAISPSGGLTIYAHIDKELLQEFEDSGVKIKLETSASSSKREL